MAEVDYIIVGAGTAGCVLASRLSASGRHRVLLLEAGGSDRSIWISVPIGYGRTFTNPRFNWLYEAEPDPTLAGRRAFWPRGKVLGGSSSINAMVYVRGQPGDFDDWAAAGNPGWTWREVLPYFRKLEDHVLGASQYHGAGGPIRVSDVSRQVHPLCETFIRTCVGLGIPRTADFNGAQTEGAGLWHVSIHDGRRVSAASAYLRPALRRPNLEVRTHAQATRVCFEGTRAAAVEYLHAGERRQVRAQREVILAAGSINSPQLLELSGVGDAARLGPLGIPVVCHAPAVGNNLQDHFAVSYFYKSSVRTLNDELAPWLGKVRAALRYALTRGGPLSMSVNQAGAFLRGRDGLTRPNLHIYFNPASYATTLIGAGRRLLNPDPYSAFLMSFNSCRPTSRGSIHLRSADPLQPPAIQPNALSSPEDIAEVYEGARVLRRISGAAPLKDVIEQELQPGPAVLSEQAVLEDFRQRAGSVFHACGTCIMGPDPHRAVVDAQLRVHGLAGLRVVDASVFPNVTSGNTNTPTLMLAEKAAELILS
ncbi:MAG TPA: GMC family oxidoreductase N-terminal domain-containing protein [Steroidobacteraceae bacterium]|nr:GMC family oxidoreductase N-terminal domain-containing protein [Steroidobacteraceae bacterium]